MLKGEKLYFRELISVKGLLLITEYLSVRYNAFQNLKLNNTLIVCSHLYTIQGTYTQEFHTTIVPGILDKSWILIIHQGDALPPVQSGSVHQRLQTAFHATRKSVVRSATSSFSPKSTMSPMTSLTYDEISTGWTILNQKHILRLLFQDESKT